jgi:hypothetical protein
MQQQSVYGVHSVLFCCVPATVQSQAYAVVHMTVTL